MEQLKLIFALKEQCEAAMAEPSCPTVLHVDLESSAKALAFMNRVENASLGITVLKMRPSRYPLHKTIVAHPDIIVPSELQTLRDVIRDYINQIEATILVSLVLLASFVLVIPAFPKCVLLTGTALGVPSSQSFVRMEPIRTRTQQGCMMKHSALHVISDIFVSGVKFLGNAMPGIFAIEAIQLLHQTALIEQLEKYVPTAFTVLSELPIK